MQDLRTFPSTLRTMLESVPPELLTKRSAAGFFSCVENAWHLADLEVEGYGERLRRLLAEESPSLPDFRGDVIAEERDYNRLQLAPALERFERARSENLALIDAASDEDKKRIGEQEGVGTVTFERVVAMMREHDQSHAEELKSLFGELGL
ncbi:MAG TPA: DinB family protein [Thermoanaerobaculia bacterium]|nr:DinB family protein [Thermoanaerobaculia bacterium]